MMQIISGVKSLKSNAKQCHIFFFPFRFLNA